MTVPAITGPQNTPRGVSGSPRPLPPEAADEIGRRIAQASRKQLSVRALGLYSAALGQLGVNLADWLAAASGSYLAKLAGLPNYQAAGFLLSELVDAGLLIRAGRIAVQTADGRTRYQRRYMLAPVMTP